MASVNGTVLLHIFKLYPSVLNLSFVCIDGFFFNRGIHMYIEHKIEDKKTTTKINTIIKRRNRISITNDIT